MAVESACQKGAPDLQAGKEGYIVVIADELKLISRREV